MELRPLDLQIRRPDKLLIVWTDGVKREYLFSELRAHCPCASCREKRSAKKPASPFAVLSKEEAQPVQIIGMEPVGSYAYNVQFSDGHDTGIFTLEFLRELGREVSA